MTRTTISTKPICTQPLTVMKVAPGSEALGHDQRHHEISGERQRDEKGENGNEHRCASQTIEAAGIQREQRQHAKAENKIEKVEHLNLHGRAWKIGRPAIRFPYELAQPIIRKA